MEDSDRTALMSNGMFSEVAVHKLYFFVCLFVCFFMVCLTHCTLLLNNCIHPILTEPVLTRRMTSFKIRVSDPENMCLLQNSGDFNPFNAYHNYSRRQYEIYIFAEKREPVNCLPLGKSISFRIDLFSEEK